jgi:KTSC domain
MSWTKNVFSSHVETIGFNDETGELEVTWKNGRRSVYEGVDEGTAVALANAPSVGRMLHNEIKNQFRHRYVS